MAILGKIDAATFSNNVAVTNGDATVTKNAADTVVVGDVLELGNVAYIVKQVNSTTSIELHKNYAGSTNSGLSGVTSGPSIQALSESASILNGTDSSIKWGRALSFFPVKAEPVNVTTSSLPT